MAKIQHAFMIEVSAPPNMSPEHVKNLLARLIKMGQAEAVRQVDGDGVQTSELSRIEISTPKISA